MSFILSIKPGIAKRYLLFLAAFVWTFAGGMLLFKGISYFNYAHNYLWLNIVVSSIGGLLFYLLLFSRISIKHVRRIIALESNFPCLFSFFSIKSYIIMTIMITSGILLKKLNIILPEPLSIIDATMGIPLLLSALRFYYVGIYYQRFKIKN